MSALSVLELREVACQRGPVAVHELSLAFGIGSFHLLAGDRDSGHELALRLLGLLDVPDAGSVVVEGSGIEGLGEDERVQLRDRRLGFVFTSPFLLPAFTAIENIAMPLFKLSEVDAPEARRRSESLLDFVGLMELAQAPCSELAPLEQHCAALARALINEPVAILVESLDGELAGEELSAFAALLRQATERYGVAVIATVSPAFLPAVTDRVIEIAEGRVRRDSEILPGAGT